MKEQDVEESVTQETPPAAGEVDLTTTTTAKDAPEEVPDDTGSPKESEPEAETPQTNTPPQGDGAESEGNATLEL